MEGLIFGILRYLTKLPYFKFQLSRGTRELLESGILGFGIRDRAQGIQNPASDTIRNPNSTDKES